MIIDAAENALGEKIDCDVAIIGSGAAGITLGLALSNLGASVVIAEAGGIKSTEESQSYFAGEPEGQRPVALEIMRQRCLGGTTTTWGGRCIPLDPIDFSKRSWIAHSGWPIDHDELARFYPDALRLCQAGRSEFSATALGIPELVAGFENGEVTSDNLERWSLPLDFGREYRAELERNPAIRLLLNAPCVDIRVRDGYKHVESIVLQGKDRTRIHARYYCLCAGGLEVPRLLLAANSQMPHGIGNEHDVVGRFYMGHLCGIIAQASFDPQRRTAPGYHRDDDGVYVRRRFSITEEAQRRESLPNMAALLHHPMIGNPSHGNGVLSLMFLAIYFFRSVRSRIPPCFLGLKQGRDSETHLFMLHVANVFKDLPNVMTRFPGFAINRLLAKRRIPSFVPPNRSGKYPIYYHIEQEPNPQSRVHLSASVDELGMPRLKTEFRTTKGDLEGVMRVHEFLGEYFTRTAIGKIEYLSANPEQDVLAQFDMGDAHYLGTTRMGIDPAESVVDAECRVHGYDNLFIVSSSVFPTSAQANPTLTIVAMALRAAGIIDERLRS